MVITIRHALVATLGLTLAVPAGGSAPPAPPVQDGEPTAAACAPFGFQPAHPRHVVTRAPIRAYAGAGAVTTRIAPPPPPSPPPPPRMMQRESTSLGDVAVTGSRAPSAGAPSVAHHPWPHPLPRPVPGDTERYPDAAPNPVRRVADAPVSTFSIDVDTAAYANVRRFIEDDTAPPRDAVRVEELINYFDYGYDRPVSADQPFAVTTAVAAAPWAPQRQVVHIGLQGYELPAAERRPLNLTFLVDVSGSMSGEDRLELAKKSMNLVIDRLRPQDRVAVTYYASGAGTTLAPTPGDQKLKLRCAVASLGAGGGTGGAQGLANAYDQAQAGFARDRVNRILLFTDGDFNLGVTDNQRLEDYVAAKRASGVYLSIYGYGRGNYQDARMQVLAQAGNGAADYVDDLSEARRLFGPRFDRGAFPIADDVKIQVEFNPAQVSEYRLIGYETRLLNEEDFANDRIDAGEVGSGASVTALYEITPVGAAGQVPDRRYDGNQRGTGGAQAAQPSGELGFVQIRYKRPGETESRLIQHPVRAAVGRAPESTRWALAVAAFGQKLRADPWLQPGYDWPAILEQAQSARGEDPYGDRAEFVQLVRAAQGLPERREP